MNNQGSTEYAAIDLGSNSFHMVVAVDDHHGISVIDRVRETVRLASGLDEKNKISNEVQERALDCLSRFGERLRGLNESHVRIVGTNTLRKAKNAASFLRKAEEALGYSIDIISGIEEARLIYKGVAYTLQEDRGRRLVIDIGGGSTELIVGDRNKIIDLESLYMGCVSYTRRFFKKGKISPDRMRKAILAAQLELEPHTRKFKRLEWKDVIGTSGTARAIEQVVCECGWSQGGITIASIEQLIQAIIESDHIEKLNIPGLGEERQPVFVGGVVVMAGIFRSLKTRHMRISDGSLREGVLTELIGRHHQRDTRAETVGELVKRHHIDSAQAARVQQTATDLFRMAKGTWGLGKRGRKILQWAAQLHEIGLSLAHSQYHKHGAYILQYMDLPGFSRQEQCSLSVLVRLHRRKFDNQVFEQCASAREGVLKRLAILLRISVLFNRGRGDEESAPIELVVQGATIWLSLPREWLEDHPLTMADLQQEQIDLEQSDIRLVLKAKK